MQGTESINLYEIGSGTGRRYVMHPHVVVVVHSVVMKAHAMTVWPGRAVPASYWSGAENAVGKNSSSMERDLSRYKAGIYR